MQSESLAQYAYMAHQALDRFYLRMMNHPMSCLEFHVVYGPFDIIVNYNRNFGKFEEKYLRISERLKKYFT